MREDVERQLQLHAYALRGLARDLVGDQDADDLVQETALQALRSPPRRGGPLGGWLASIVRRLAARHQRTERRRRAREQRVARPEAVVRPPGASSEEQTALRSLTEALLALPEPYRGALFQRYLKGLTPTAIATETGEPLATVKSRLARGLQLLRARLERDDQDWRPALAAAFALDDALVTTTTGVVLMGLSTKMLFGGAVAALLLAGWLLLPRNGSLSPMAGPPAQAARAEAAAAAIGPDARETLERTPVAEPHRDGVLADGQAVVRGRCVDEYARPLSGCRVELCGRRSFDRGPDFAREYGQWLAAHPGERWRDLDTATGADGTFAFAFVFAPLGYELRLCRDVLIHVQRVDCVVAGACADLGDVVVPVTCTVQGRVVDTGGRPMCATEVSIWPQEHDPLHFVDQVGYALPGPEGTFTKRVVAGNHDVRVNGFVPDRGAALTVPIGTSWLECEIVVRSLPEDATIEGSVVDELGLPIDGATVLVVPHPISATTDRDGRFELWRPPDMHAEQVIVVAYKEPSWETLEPEEVHTRWGARDVRFVLRREPESTIQLCVVRSADNEPVPDYRVQYGSRNDSRSGPFEDGVVHLAVPASQKYLLVDPDRWDLWPSGWVPVAHGEQMEVRLQQARERTLRVVHPGGRPATDITVEVLDGDETVTAETRAYPLASWGGAMKLAVALMSRGRTDANGELQVRGPVDHPVTLRLPGPGHPPRIVAGVRVDVVEPLVVELQAGCRLEGRLSPPTVVRELRAARGLGLATPVGNVRHGEAGIRLRRGQQGSFEFAPSPTEPPLVVDEEGRFAIDVASGSWEVCLRRWDAEAWGFAAESLEPVASVEVHEARTTRIGIDLPTWCLAELQGLVLTNGRPLADHVVRLRLADGKGEGALVLVGDDTVRTDADGRFRMHVREGTFRFACSLTVRTSTYLLWELLESRDEVFVPAGARVEHTFHLDTGKPCLRVVGADGAPVADVWLFLRPARGRRHQTSASDADGRILCEAEPGTYTVQVLPRSMQGRFFARVQDWNLRRMGGDPGAGAWIDLGTITVAAGTSEQLDVRLPESWFR